MLAETTALKQNITLKEINAGILSRGRNDGTAKRMCPVGVPSCAVDSASKPFLSVVNALRAAQSVYVIKRNEKGCSRIVRHF